MRYSPIEVYKPPITNNNNNPIELPSIPSIPSIPNIPNTPNTPAIPSVPVNPIIPTIPNPPVIPPDTDNPLNTATGILDKDFYTGGQSVELVSNPNIYIDIENFDFQISQTTVLAIQSDGNILVNTFNTESYINNIFRINQDGDIDESFDSGDISCCVFDIKEQSDGKILVGGDFNEYRGESTNGIVRLNSDGSRDTSFNIGTGFGGNVNNGDSVNTLAIQEDGKIIVGGNFTSYNGVGANKIIRLNSDGSRDLSFDIGTGFNSGDRRVFELAIQADGKILVGGQFWNYKGQSANGIIRLNSDGSRDLSFDMGAGFGGDMVTSIVVQSDGNIMVGGDFRAYKNNSVNRLIRLASDGETDLSFNADMSFPNINEYFYIQDIYEQNDGTLFISFIGAFDTLQDFGSGVVKLNSNGSRDTSFSLDSARVRPFGLPNIPHTILLVNNTIFTGGFIVTVDNLYNADGELIDMQMIDFENEDWIDDFNTYGGAIDLTFGSILKFNLDGSRSIDFESEWSSRFKFTNKISFDPDVSVVTTQNDGKILVGGWFSNYKGEAANRIIRLNIDGSRDTSFDVGEGFDGNVNTITIQSDGKIIVGGGFQNYKGESANKIIRLNSDGSRDTGFDVGEGFDGNVNTITIQSDGNILVGGDFSNYKVETANRIIRLNSDGSRDISFNIGTGFDSDVNTIAIQSDGKIIVGGYFRLYQGELQYNEEYDSTEMVDQGGASANHIIRLNSNGSRDMSFNIGTGFDDGVETIAIQDDGKIIVGGYFGLYQGELEYNEEYDYTEMVDQGGASANKIIRLNSDGIRDTIFDVGEGFDNGVATLALAIQSDGKIIVGGWFSSYQGVESNDIARLNLDGSLDYTFDTGTGFTDGSVYTLSIQSDGKILVGGFFENYNNQGATYLLRLK